MKQYEDYELDLVSVNGGKINWDSVAGHCLGRAIIGGAFSGDLAAGVGCVVKSGKEITSGL